MFVALPFVCGNGLATLEAAANAYIVVLGPPRHAAMRLTLARSFNGIAIVIGPIIASLTFFNGANQYFLRTVRYVYLALSVFALLINALVLFAILSEVSRIVTAEPETAVSAGGF